MKIVLFCASLVVLTLSLTWCFVTLIVSPSDWISLWFGFPWALAAAEALYISLEK
jgi:hypothetical protein